MIEGRNVRVLAPGVLSLIEDRGRFGYLSAGVGNAGAADLRSFELANRLVANEPGAAVIEVTFGGLVLEFGFPALIAVTGAPAQLSVGDRLIGHASLAYVESGQTVSLGTPAVGVRSYLAIRGGIDVAPVMGSRSADTLSGVGPARLATDTVLPIGPEPAEWPLVEQAPVPAIDDGALTIRAPLGPRQDWVTDPRALYATEWVVSEHSDRVGLRLRPTRPGAALSHAFSRELPVEGVMTGGVQVPPSGLPVVFLADHPVTGGYPVVATVSSRDIPLLAQARPGQHIRFRERDPRGYGFPI
jgi:biotin-dependent carboxylase-like uncharacterized protein